MSLPEPTDRLDVVIMWVDGSDPKAAAARAKAARTARARGCKIDNQPGRSRDNGELMFLLRSIHANMPWHGHIYIVTNGQKPRYVDFSKPGISLVTHRDIFTDPSLLPTFNSFAIESMLHRIDGLSEHFVRFSDDFFIGRPAGREAFQSPGGLGMVYLGHDILGYATTPYNRLIQHNAIRFHGSFGFLPRLNYVHAPQCRSRRIMAEMVDFWPDWFATTRSNRFRSPSDAVPLFLYPYFMMWTQEREALIAFSRTGEAENIIHVTAKSPLSRLIYVGFGAGGNREWKPRLLKMLRSCPTFFNINDSFGSTPNPNDVAFVGAFLRDLFPKPSPFELPVGDIPGFAAVTCLEVAE